MSKAMILRRRGLGLGSCKGMKEASETGLDFIRNDKLNRVRWDSIGMVIRWGCTSSVPCNNVLNTASAIKAVNDKSGFRRTLSRVAPHTIPNTWFTTNARVSNGWGVDIVPPNGVVVRPQRHAQGRLVFLCHTPSEVQHAATICGEGYYISEYINKVKEFRVYPVSGRVATVAEKTPDDPNAVAWNVALGGRFDVVPWGEWNLDVCKVALEAFNHSGLDFGGVDVMVDAEGRAYVIEINSAPSLPLLSDGSVSYRQKCMAKCFDWIVEHGKEHIEVEHDSGWRGYVHPAIWSWEVEETT